MNIVQESTLVCKPITNEKQVEYSKRYYAKYRDTILAKAKQKKLALTQNVPELIKTCPIISKDVNPKKCSEASREKRVLRSKRYYENHKDNFKKYYKDNKESIVEKQKQHYEANREQIAAKHKEYNDLHKAEILAQKKEYYINNRQKVIDRTVAYNKEHKDEITQRHKEYYKKNKDRLTEMRHVKVANQKVKKPKKVKVSIEQFMVSIGEQPD